MDRVAHILANRLVGNRDGDATLEITLTGPELLFEQETVVALTGADLTPMIDGFDLPLWTSRIVTAGSRLSFGSRRTGGRCYLAVAGGLELPIVLGSRATHVASRTGGLQGRALLSGDRLGSRASSLPTAGKTVPEGLRPRYSHDSLLRIVPGPERNTFTQEAFDRLTSHPYRLSIQSNRMGYRLDGPPLAHGRTEPRLSDGTALGALQVPPDGQPILLMADRQTTGGYPILAVVISADWHMAGQLLPGDTVRFTAITLSDAQTALAALWTAWDQVLPPESGDVS